MTSPLEGIRIIDMTIWQQGPFSTAILTDLGADVIKIEGPDAADPGRNFNAPVTSHGLNAYFQNMNRGKRSLVIDLKQEGGRNVFYKLVAGADAMVSNMRTPALKKLGADYETLVKIKPDIVFGHASGYGPAGPDKDLGSMDNLGQARGGIMSLRMQEGERPRGIGTAVADQTGAICMAFAMMTALFHRERTGEGQKVDCSLLGSQLALQALSLTMHLFRHDQELSSERLREGTNPIWNSYQGSDGKWFVIGMMNDRYWPGLCRAIGRAEWVDNPDYSTLTGRSRNGARIVQELTDLFATKTAEEWVRILSDADLLATRVQNYDEVIQDPQNLINGYVTEVSGEGHPPIRMVGLPWKFSKTPGAIRGFAPEFGQHTEEVLLEAGFTWDDLTTLRAQGIIGARP